MGLQPQRSPFITLLVITRFQIQVTSLFPPKWLFPHCYFVNRPFIALLTSTTVCTYQGVHTLFLQILPIRVCTPCSYFLWILPIRVCTPCSYRYFLSGCAHPVPTDTSYQGVHTLFLLPMDTSYQGVHTLFLQILPIRVCTPCSYGYFLSGCAHPVPTDTSYQGVHTLFLRILSVTKGLPCNIFKTLVLSTEQRSNAVTFHLLCPRWITYHW